MIKKYQLTLVVDGDVDLDEFYDGERDASLVQNIFRVLLNMVTRPGNKREHSHISLVLTAYYSDRSSYHVRSYYSEAERVTLRKVDPELERLLAEEEAVERRYRDALERGLDDV